MSLVLRLVLDTSTLVSAALRPGSVPSQAFAKAMAAAEVCASEATLEELDLVMSRPKFDRYLPLSDRQDFASLVRQYSRAFQVPTQTFASITECRDPKDVKFLALAVACGAQVLVSSDDDLLCLQPFRGIQVLSPVAFLVHPLVV